ncbi:DUF397 domain-containing protein [Phytomonospora endophytica]|uniref:DUF397 domain-containing protein n=1 Tax=Phytomonospora endophytica TaxID=714109 RepID=A0A841FYI6_9ACTN|nr:hypothetical protein [Phytomonospora endophytica]GIG69275.1 hypothetical protein Pen01_55700 [Phytomonospora endophytica]
MATSPWRKSKRSQTGGQCVQIRTDATLSHVEVADTKHGLGSSLKVTPGTWVGFIQGLKQ